MYDVLIWVPRINKDNLTSGFRWPAINAVRGRVFDAYTWLRLLTLAWRLFRASRSDAPDIMVSPPRITLSTFRVKPIK